jgi:hypothetical protein
MFYFTLHNAIFKWGKDFMKAHPVSKFEKLEVVCCKCYWKIQTYEQVDMALQMIKQGGDEKVEVYYEHIHKLTNCLQH